MDNDRDLAAKLLAELRAVGAELSERDGRLRISGPEEELHKFMQSHRAIFEGLRGILLELIRGEPGPSTTVVVAAPAPIDPPSDAAPPERWEHLNDSGGLDAMMNHAMGGGPIPSVPVAQVSIRPSSARREEYKRAPMHAGVYIATPEFQGWRERWRQAAAQGREQEFLADNPAPYRFPNDGGP
jgi:hypothetical protein